MSHHCPANLVLTSSPPFQQYPTPTARLADILSGPFSISLTAASFGATAKSLTIPADGVAATQSHAPPALEQETSALTSALMRPELIAVLLSHFLIQGKMWNANSKPIAAKFKVASADSAKEREFVF